MLLALVGVQHGLEGIKLAAGETLNRRAGFSRKLTQAAAFTCKAFTPSDPSQHMKRFPI